eukprot:SAG31_NODE_1426_length_8393_cov_3.363275_6_plen_206_part_00
MAGRIGRGEPYLIHCTRPTCSARSGRAGRSSAAAVTMGQTSACMRRCATLLLLPAAAVAAAVGAGAALTGARGAKAAGHTLCSLNGVLSSQGGGTACICDPGWTGNACGVLDLLPASKRRAAYPPPGLAAATTAWGGRGIWDEGTRLWHGWFAEMGNHCGMSVWQSNSLCRHATAKTVLGPYQPTDEGTIAAECQCVLISAQCSV